MTPPEYAIQKSNDPQIIKLLLGLGADPMLVSEDTAKRSQQVTKAIKQYILVLTANLNRKKKSQNR